jgi:hypothetical protein
MEFCHWVTIQYRNIGSYNVYLINIISLWFMVCCFWFFYSNLKRICRLCFRLGLAAFSITQKGEPLTRPTLVTY